MIRTTLLLLLIMATPLAADDCLYSLDPCSTAAEPWRLLGESACGVTATGWVATGSTANAHGNRTGKGNLPLGMNTVADGPIVNQLYAVLEKEVELGECSFDWGFRVDYLFGTDTHDFQAFGDGGFDFGWNSSRDYGSAIPQLYADVAYGNTKISVGRFYTLIGYESSMTPDNFFYSRTYAFYYGEPNTHTGLLAAHEASENWTLLGGWVMGWDSGFCNHLNASMFLGGVSWTVCDDLTVTYSVNAGDFGDGVGKNGLESFEGTLFNHSIIAELTLTPRLTYVIAHDMGDNRGLGAGNSEWYALGQYLTYEINDAWLAGIRFEWFRDDDGTRVAVNGAGAGSYYAITTGLNWRPHPNLMIRPEVRWDWFDGVGLPFDGVDDMGTEDHMFTGGVDAVVLF